jgi:hypothetical protein
VELVPPSTLPEARGASTDAFVLTLWTADPVLAARADAAGVDRVGVDLERIGKAERQRGLGTWISPHSEVDLGPVGTALKRADLFARVNPLHDRSDDEVETVIALGARVLMLPMVAHEDEAAQFVALVGGRATVVLLVECAEAIERIDRLAAVYGVDEIHLGLNDLALSLGMPNRWLTLAGDLALDAGERVRAAGKRFGIGGIGRVDQEALPVPADLVYAEYARTGAAAALLSRSFSADPEIDLAHEVTCARERLESWRRRSRERVDEAHAELGRCAHAADCW